MGTASFAVKSSSVKLLLERFCSDTQMRALTGNLEKLKSLLREPGYLNSGRYRRTRGLRQHRRNRVVFRADVYTFFVFRV